jgi:hypothetical protein
MSYEEQRLLRAEAYMRLGQPALAVPIINETRMDAAKGALPAVGLNGVNEPYPRCVPKSFENAEMCGNLWDALLWEKRMEQMGTDGMLNWVDWRAWGYLYPGTIVYFPASMRETVQQGFGYYTYGGTLPGTASGFKNIAAPCSTLTGWRAIGCTDYESVDRLPRRY